MDRYDHLFTPDQVDEQIEYSAREWPATPEGQLLTEIQRVAQQIRTEQNRSLQRTWLRLQQKSRESALSAQQRKENIMQDRSFLAFPHDTSKSFPKKPAHRIWPVLRLSAAVLVVAILIGSFVVMLNMLHTSTPHSGSLPTSLAMPRGKVLSTVHIASDNFQAIAWSPDSQRVAGGLIGHVQIWNAITGKLLLDVATHDQLFSLAWSPDGHSLAISGRTVRIINPDTGALVREFPHPLTVESSSGPYLSALTSLSGGGVPIESTAWSPDGSLMASAIGDEVVVWKPATGAVVYTFRGQSGLYDNVNAVSWSSDGTYIASTSSYHGTLQVWNSHTGQVIFHRTLSDASDPYADVAWAPSGMRLAFISDSHTTEVWNVATNTRITSSTTPHPGRLAWSPDGSEIASIDGNSVDIWGAKTGTVVYRFAMQGERVFVVAWSPNGKYIVSSTVTEQSAEAVVWAA